MNAAERNSARSTSGCRRAGCRASAPSRRTRRAATSPPTISDQCGRVAPAVLARPRSGRRSPRPGPRLDAQHPDRVKPPGCAARATPAPARRRRSDPSSDDRDVHQEHPAPPDVGEQPAARGSARSGTRGSSPPTRSPTALGRSSSLNSTVQRGQRHHDHAGAREPEQHAGGDELAARGRRGARRRPERRTAPARPSSPSCGRSGRRAGRPGASPRPAPACRRTRTTAGRTPTRAAARERRQRHAQHRPVQADRQHGQAHRAERPPPAPALESWIRLHRN